MGKFGHQTFTRIRLKGGTGSYIRAPVLTTTQRDALTGEEGMVIFNSTTDQLEEYDGATWEAIGQIILDTHTADPDAHHSEEIPEGRGYYGTTTLLSIPGGQAAAGTPVALSGDSVFYFPIHIRTPITIDQVVIEVTTAASAGKKCRIAIYAADTNWQPGVRQVASAEIAIDAIAVVATAITETTLQEGRYLIALTLEETATVMCMRYGEAYLGYVITLGAAGAVESVRVAKAYAALADPGTAWDTAAGGSTGFKQVVFLRVKTP